jgi:pyridoxine 5-phosphate synthase
MPHLGINIDHVATVRQARYPKNPFAHNAEPLVLEAARQSIAAGAVGITVHLRADRRHIQDADVKNLRAEPGLRLNLEMGNTPEIVEIALQTRPDEACLVPENREEVTTEGGLDVVRLKTLLAPTVRRLTEAGTRVSMFIEPDAAQIDASLALGAHMVELHTGAFANAQGDAQLEELQRLIAAANHAHHAGLQVNAGHGINYTNIALIRQVPHLVDLNIGHSIIARSLFTGLPEAVREMIQLMNLPA